MADYEMAFIITDSEMKKITANSDEKEIVKRANLTPDMISQFVPFNAAAIVGEKDLFGRVYEYIKGDKNEIVCGGNTLVGVIPVPWEETYTVGNNFTTENIFELSVDGSVKKEGYAKIEKIIVCKTKNDTEEIVNYFAEVNASHGRQVKYAEESDPESPNFNPYGDYPDYDSSWKSTGSAATQAAETCPSCSSHNLGWDLAENHPMCNDCGGGWKNLSAEGNMDLWGAEYEKHLAEVYQSLHPPHRNYQANV